MGFCYDFFFFCISTATGKCCLQRNPSVVSEQPCVHQNRFVVESFWFLVFGTHVFKVFENEIFGIKRLRSSVVFVVYEED